MNAAATSELFDNALRLPEASRAELAHRLLETLGPECEPDSDEEFREMLRERIDDFRSGKAKTYSVDEVRQRVKAKLSEVRAKASPGQTADSPSPDPAE